MKMSAIFAAAVGVSFKPLVASAFFVKTAGKAAGTRFFSTSSPMDLTNGVSRLETLQTLLETHGAPGSRGCAGPLRAITSVPQKFTDVGTIDKVTGSNDYDQAEAERYLKLHPHLLPIAESESTGTILCALRRVFADDAPYESSSRAPWPIVEAKLNGPGMSLVALSSEHLMRRIVCECDDSGVNTELIETYNKGLGEGTLADSGFDQPYEIGSVKKLGYGVDKYVLLRVGPFADIYEKLAEAHRSKGDESSSLITAEAANGKVSGFASTFLYYAKLLASFPNRDEEARDAARVCLRLPLPSIGMNDDDFKQAAVLGQVAEAGDDMPAVLAKLQTMYEKIRAHEREDPQAAQGKTPETMAIEEANYLLDSEALRDDRDWESIRPKLEEIYASVGREDMASFVNPQVTSKFA